MPKFNADHKLVLDEMLLTHPLVHSGKMFGLPAYYVGKKLCICLYEAVVGIKLPAESVARLLQADLNAVPFKPYGRQTMREWVQVNLTRSEDYRQYMPVFEESIQHVHAHEGER